ncbi:MAG TPA: hypothetical protein VFO14_05995 [Vicinamibacterales bacterium]|nr:hypothetical protein [Vicinamibacterales bacterium]
MRPRTMADREQLVIAPHHPDRLNRPPARLGAVNHERFQQTLAWNVFRTLELLAPAFWLRRFHVRLTGDEPPPAPQMLHVSLWRSLPLPPIQRIDGARGDEVVDIIIETEHAVWTLFAASGRNRENHEKETVARLIDAGAWLAGARRHYGGVIETEVTDASFGGVLKSRYSRSRESVTLRSASRGPARPTLSGWGALRWTDMAALLHECEDAHNLSPIERALARNAVGWLRDVGIEPSAPSR